MKKIILFVFSLGATGSFAQDTIYTRSGEVIPAKVYEIGATEIKYKKPSNPDGPLYVTTKEQVAVIQYKNGSKDVFQQEPVDDVYNTSRSTNDQAYNNQRSKNVNVVIAPPPIVVGPTWGYRHRRHYHWHWRWGWWW